MSQRAPLAPLHDQNDNQAEAGLRRPAFDARRPYASSAPTVTVA